MGLIRNIINALFRRGVEWNWDEPPLSTARKQLEASEKKSAGKTENPEKTERIKKQCKSCGKTFSVDPSWEHIPNYCKECRQRFAREKEEKQRAGAPRKIRRTCRSCGKVFTFPSTLEHYPNYCPNCRKNRKQEMKAKYGQPVKRAKGENAKT